MEIAEARKLLDLLELQAPKTDIRLAINDVDLMDVLRKEKYHVVLERTAWSPAELSIPCKAE